MLWMRKARQEKVLESLILSSKLVSAEVLAKVLSSYLDNPYHNYLHALKITGYILQLSPSQVNITELRSLLFAALFHDAGRSADTHALDEFQSLGIASEYLDSLARKGEVLWVDSGIMRQSIMGTVFSERGKISNRYAQILSDADIGVIGEDLANYCYYSIPLYLEFRQDFQTFISVSQKNYIRYLMKIDSRIIISEEIRSILPNSYRTIAEFCKLDMETKIAMHDILQKEDITLEEFREKFSLS